jgi:hypothetical protein
MRDKIKKKILNILENDVRIIDGTALADVLCSAIDAELCPVCQGVGVIDTGDTYKEEEHTCGTCKHREKHKSYDPCRTCDVYAFRGFKQTHNWEEAGKHGGGYGDYTRGLKEGVRMYAWWKDGTQRVGTCGTTLKHALELIDIKKAGKNE